MRRNLLLVLGVAAVLTAQTQIDLNTQSKPASRPVRSGTSLPVDCVPGQLFVKTNAPEGQSVYACATLNVWTYQGGQVSIFSDGVEIGTRPIQNYAAGIGFLQAFSDAGTRLDIVNSVDTAVIQTRANAQISSDLLCESSSASGTSFTCALSPVLNAYVRGMLLHWIPDVTVSGGGTTLQVNTLAAIPVKLADGVTDPGPSHVPAGALQTLWYDGSAFRLNVFTEKYTYSSARPTCDETLRGRLWFQAAILGESDQFALCAKNAEDLYDWRIIF